MEFNRYARFVLVYILVAIVADGMGLLLGAIANPVVRQRYLLSADTKIHSRFPFSLSFAAQNGTFIAAMITAFKLAFCGFLAFWDHIPFAMRQFTYLSTHSFGLEALVLSLYDHNRSGIVCPENILYCHFK